MGIIIGDQVIIVAFTVTTRRQDSDETPQNCAPPLPKLAPHSHVLLPKGPISAVSSHESWRCDSEPHF